MSTFRVFAQSFSLYIGTVFLSSANSYNSYSPNNTTLDRRSLGSINLVHPEMSTVHRTWPFKEQGIGETDQQASNA